MMCKKKNYCNREIDSCIRNKVTAINSIPDNNGSSKFATMLSCCGHDKYPKTIVVFNRRTYEVFEWFTKTVLSQGKRKGKKYYRSDSEGNYFLPEILQLQVHNG